MFWNLVENTVLKKIPLNLGMHAYKSYPLSENSSGWCDLVCMTNLWYILNNWGHYWDKWRQDLNVLQTDIRDKWRWTTTAILFIFHRAQVTIFSVSAMWRRFIEALLFFAANWVKGDFNQTYKLQNKEAATATVLYTLPIFKTSLWYAHNKRCLMLTNVGGQSEQLPQFVWETERAGCVWLPHLN